MRCSWRLRSGRACTLRPGDHKYIAYLDENFQKTSELLYNKQEHLYARDATYLNKTEPNGKLMFWSRGNGWVMAGHRAHVRPAARGRRPEAFLCAAAEGDGGPG